MTVRRRRRGGEGGIGTENEIILGERKKDGKRKGKLAKMK
jgi:hypothetical protein